jgi:MFS family permease
MKQLRILFLINLILYFTGSSLYPLFPLFDAALGATPATIGLHLALISGSNAVGIALSGRLVARVAPKRLFIAASLLGILALLALVWANQLWQVVVATSLLWLSGGFVYALATLYGGLIAGDGNRGRSFGLLVLASPAGAVLGGLIVGGAIVRLGFSAAFLGLAVLWLAIPALVLLALPDLRAAARDAGEQLTTAPRVKVALGLPFYLMMGMAVLAAAAAGVGNISLNLSMQSLQFSPQAISTTTVVSGLVAIPVTFYIGGLSDRIGRRRVLLANFVMLAAVVIGLMRAGSLWHFWVGAAALMMAGLVTNSMTSALATDLLPRASLERGLPLLMSVMTMVGIPASLGSGYLMQLRGPAAAFAVAGALALGALGALALLSAGPRIRPFTVANARFGRRLARRPASA